MAEMLADLTTGEEQESSSEERDESSVRDNDSDFSDAESSDKDFIKFSLMLVCFL